MGFLCLFMSLVRVGFKGKVGVGGWGWEQCALVGSFEGVLERGCGGHIAARVSEIERTVSREDTGMLGPHACKFNMERAPNSWPWLPPMQLRPKESTTYP